jgi:hypothetical protein
VVVGQFGPLGRPCYPRAISTLRHLCVCTAILWLAGCGGRPAERYLVPDGYVGYMEIIFDVPDAPRFPREDGFRLVRVPESGRVETAEPALDGEGYRQEYYYERTDGTRRKAPTVAGFTITDTSSHQVHWYVFVGERSDEERYRHRYGDDLHHLKIGRLEGGTPAREPN